MSSNRGHAKFPYPHHYYMHIYDKNIDFGQFWHFRIFGFSDFGCKRVWVHPQKPILSFSPRLYILLGRIGLKWTASIILPPENYQLDTQKWGFGKLISGFKHGVILGYLGYLNYFLGVGSSKQVHIELFMSGFSSSEMLNPILPYSWIKAHQSFLHVLGASHFGSSHNFLEKTTKSTKLNLWTLNQP